MSNYSDENIDTDKCQKINYDLPLEYVKKLYNCSSGFREEVNLQIKLDVTMEDLNKVRNECMKLRRVLEEIVKWELPETGKFVDEEKKFPASYGFLYGRNGERDYFRDKARAVLIEEHATGANVEIERLLDICKAELAKAQKGADVREYSYWSGKVNALEQSLLILGV